MSLFGKILAVLNLLGAAGLIYFASADYAKRQAWAHAYTRAELLLNGIPLDEKELDSSSQLAVERLGGPTSPTCSSRPAAGRSPPRRKNWTRSRAS
jgi:hypothetical protein